MMERHTAKEALEATNLALHFVYNARDQIHLVSDGYACPIPSNAIYYLARVSEWLRDTKTMLESELDLN